jgi:hypothetical protein
MAQIILQIEYVIVGTVILVISSILFYTIFNRLYSAYFTKHYLVFLDSEGKIKEIISKTLKKDKNTVKYKKNEYCIDPVHRYHILAYDEKNELKIKKDGTIDSLIKNKTVEEYELAAFSMLSRLLQNKIRAVDMVMLMMLGIVLIAVIFGFIQGHK